MYNFCDSNKQGGWYFLENMEGVAVHIYVTGINKEGWILAGGGQNLEKQ